MIATNAYGNSLESDLGNGAVILTEPDSPISFTERTSLREATSLGLQWMEGANNGGSAVLDYQISYDQGSGTWVTLATGILQKQYQAIGLTAGLTYQFKV